MAQTLRIGLTGGIGSGKSTVAAMLSRLGAAVIDTDAIARRLTAADGAALPALRSEFGDGILAYDGSLDRAAMRARVFADTAQRRRLEAVLHPMIGAEAERESAVTASAVLVFDVPLLAESNRWRARVHRVVVIDCGTATQISRVAARPGWTRETAEAVVASQSSREMRRAVGDAVVFNEGIDLSDLQAHTDSLWRLWNNSRPMT
ncbi:MAG: dephospho-CoA kinase [Hyphomicrobiaceae bacterium]